MKTTSLLFLFLGLSQLAPAQVSVTRGFPIETIAGEPTDRAGFMLIDHPSSAGLQVYEVKE